jgi:hypothetical protein
MIIDECGAFTGMRTVRENPSIRKNLNLYNFSPYKSLMMRTGKELWLSGWKAGN